jgi:hypothetical protein
MRITWEMIALATRDIKRVRISKIKLLFACFHYVNVLIVYNKYGTARAYNYLAKIKQPLLAKTSQESLEQEVRRLLVVLRIIGRFFNEEHNCLRNSITLTAGLLAYGHNCKLIIGKQKTRINKIYDFHAWVEVNGIPINDNLHVRNLYSVLLSLPKQN